MATYDETIMQDGKTRKTILDTLAKYGDTLLDDDVYQGTKKKKRKRKSSDSVSVVNTVTKTKRTKRKKASSSTNDKEVTAVGGDVEVNDSETGESGEALHGEKRHLEELRQKLGLSNFLQHSRQKQEEDAANEEKKAPEGVSNMRGKQPPPEVIVFEDPAKRNRNKPKRALPVLAPPRCRFNSESSDSESVDEESGGTERQKQRGDRDARPPRDPNLFDMRRAKHDVQMFGIRGMLKKDKDKAKLEVLIKLGAKPPKNPKVNYRELQIQRKHEKAEMVEQRAMERAMGNKVSKSNNRKQRQRDRNDVGYVDGQVGRYKSGAQILSKQDIHKVKSQGGARGGHRRRR